MQSFLIYLNIVQLIPFKRLSILCKDLLNFPLCKRSIENILNRAYDKAQPLYQSIMAIIKSCLWVGADETGKRVEGKRWWEWVWQTYKATFYVISPSRGYNVVKENFGEDYRGILIHDCRAAHNNTISKTGHQQCNSHLQRDLKFLIETYKSKWAYQFNKFLNVSHRARDKIWSEKFDTELRNRTIKAYTNKLLGFINIKLKEKDVLKFQKRIKKHRDSILLFMNYKSVPFHNNSSEQAIRMTKVKQKNLWWAS